MALIGQFRFEPVFGQKKHQDFWAQTTLCPEGSRSVVQKTALGFECVPTEIEAGASLSELKSDIRYFEIFLDYMRYWPDRPDIEGEQLLSFGPFYMKYSDDSMPSLPILREMCWSLVHRKIREHRYIQNYILKIALKDELTTLAQKFPSTPVRSSEDGNDDSA